MPRVISQTSRMAQRRPPLGLPADKNNSSNVIRVTVKTAGNQTNFLVAEDTSVRQFKEELSAHFKCQVVQLVLVFMGCLLKDQDILSQRGIMDGHTIYLVIKSKHGSRSLAHSFRNLPTNEHCHWDRDTKGDSSEVQQPSGVSHTSVKTALNVEPDVPKVCSQDVEVGSPEHIAQLLENPSIQGLLSNTDLVRQFISEHPDMQQLMQQNPEVSHILDNSEKLWQTLELARNLAIIQEIMQLQPPAQHLERPLNPQSHLRSETIPGGDNALGQSRADFRDHMLNCLQDPFGGNIFTALLEGQVAEEFSPPSSPQEQQEQLPQLPTTRVIYYSSPGLSSVTSTSSTPNRVNHASKANTSTIFTEDQSHTCNIQQPAGVPALPSIELTQQSQAEDKDATLFLESSDQRSEDDLQLSDEQTSSRITRSVIQLLLNNPNLAAQVMLFMTMPQLSEQWRQQLPTFLQHTQLSDVLRALANPKASQAIMQIEQGLQLLVTEAPVLLSWVAPYLWGLAWLPAPSCSYSDLMRWAWDVPDMAKPRGPGCGHRYEAVIQRQQSLDGDPSQCLQAPEIRFSKQMESLQAMGFGNHQANLQALIATEGDTSAAILKLKRGQGF